MNHLSGINLILALGLFFCFISSAEAADPLALDDGDVNLSELRAFDLLGRCETGSIVNTVSLSSTGNYLAAGGFDHKVYYYDSRGTQLWNYTTGDIVYTVSISSDGSRIAAGSNDRKVYFFNREGELLWSRKTGGNINSVAVSSEGLYIATGGEDGRYISWTRW